MTVSATVLSEYLAKIPANTLKKGRAIFERQESGSEDDVIEIDAEGPRSIIFAVPSQSEEFLYEVKLSWTAKKLTARCDCLAFDEYGYCKHIVAAILELRASENIPDRNSGIEEAEIVGDPPAPPQQPAVPFAGPEPPRFEKFFFTSQPVHAFRNIDWNIGYRRVTSDVDRTKLLTMDPEAARWDFSYLQSAKQTFYPRIDYDRRDRFTLSCTCVPTMSVCKHLIAAANFLYAKHGAAYFQQFRDYAPERAAALKKLGLSPEDPEAGAVKFSVDSWGTLKVEVPEWLWFPGKLDERVNDLVNSLELQAPSKGSDADEAVAVEALEPGFVFNTRPASIPFGLELAVVNLAGGKFARVGLDNPERAQELRAVLTPAEYKAVMSISHASLNQGLANAGANHKIPNGVQYMTPSDRSYLFIARRYADMLETLWPRLSDPQTQVFTASDTKIHRASATPVRLSRTRIGASVEISRSGNFIELRPSYVNAETGEPLSEAISIVGNGLLLRTVDEWFLPENDSTRNLLRNFPSGFTKIPASNLATIYETLIPSLRSRYDVALSADLQPEIRTDVPQPYLQLAEQGGKALLLAPRFRYGKTDVAFQRNPQSVPKQDENGIWFELQRDMQVESDFAESIRNLHPLFLETRNPQVFSIPFSTALENSWYQKTLSLLAERNIEVRGIETLENFRYNPHQASVSVSSKDEGGSGIDWFDILIEISFGEQQVSLKEVRRALMNGQAGVRLDDGTIGLLPETFIAQFGALLKLGKDKGEGKLRVNKLHFTLIDELHEARLSQGLKEELAAKKAALQAIEQIQTADVPAAVNATLRPYQIAGFHWMQVLDKLGWGGCLADDMGLGKTLQTITFLQHLKDSNPRGVQLVVCPTSLIYNWQSELQKFAPELRYHIHYGPARVWHPEMLADIDIVITTYGLVRSDLDHLAEVNWHYVILDESQAIKNPDAQTTKAVQVLRAKNRLCLSGTPLQNNTFDLYAQFEFLNPGLLGSRDFFRGEFATPIDKQGSEAARALLRKMLAPFMLRRTKEQVAKDLPDKTEVTLWCEMEADQRAVYEEYRRYYRDSLLKRIDEDGMQGSSIYILEALLRMRQLCDHPKLVKNEAVKTTASVKLDMLRREITENAGSSKVLVFSQFTEMLQLIREGFDADGIKYAYLDGKTPAAKRKLAVEKFQNDPEEQVFLISLKAGGVGLNLTAAEYVYIVDPWWNPAVEAQAIDRTHRIGQTNKIVAYRMICKDTVEEKVMMLQSRKRALAEGLVTEDAGFVKKLTREDVAFLLE